jgi:hypothetical protein
MNLEALVTFHIDIPREGPGSGESTREAMGRLPVMPPFPAHGLGPESTKIPTWIDMFRRFGGHDKHQFYPMQ